MTDVERMCAEHGRLLKALATSYGGWEALGRAFGEHLSHAQAEGRTVVERSVTKETSRPGPEVTNRPPVAPGGVGVVDPDDWRGAGT